MFWEISAVWFALYLASYGIHAVGMLSFVLISLPVFLLGEAVIYGLSGINIINEWERRPVLLFGKYAKTAGPGFDWVEPVFHTVMPDVSVQDVTEELQVNNVQTHDNVRLNILGVLTTRTDPTNVKKLVVEVKGAAEAKRQRANAAVTEVVGRHQLDQILDKREEFSEKIRVALQEKVQLWGIDVKAVEVKDLRVADTEIEKSIAMKARAEKEGQAELRRAEFQMQIALKLKEAAHAYDDAAWKLKGLETLIELCRSAQNNTVLIPSELLGTLSNVIGKEPKPIVS